MLTERKVLNSVEVYPRHGHVNVCWLNQIVKTEGEEESIVSETPHRCSYAKEQKEQFILEVEGAANYIPLLGW